MHPVEKYQNYNLDCGWVEWVQLWRPQEEGGVELLYNLVKTGSQLVWRPDPLVTRCGRESTGERERNAVMANRVGVNMLQFCLVSNSLSHATFLIKWEVYFSKNCVARLYYCVAMIYACICIWVYNTLLLMWHLFCRLSLNDSKNWKFQNFHYYQCWLVLSSILILVALYHNLLGS